MWQVVRKEVLHNLLGLRFALGTALAVVLMGVVAYVLLLDFQARQQGYIAAVQEHAEARAETKVLSKVAVTVDFPPSPLSMFARGIRDLPGSVTVTPYSVPTLVGTLSKGTLTVWGHGDRPYNPLLRVFSRIDLAFVVRVVLGLFALLLSFDSFSGERERGTLAMVLACPVRRLEVLAGKLIGGLITAAVPLTAGFLAMLAMWSLAEEVRLDAGLLLGAAVLWLLSLVYLLAFLALGTWLSLRTRDSSSALMTSLLVWMVAAVAIPQGVGYLAQYGRPRDVRRQVMAASDTELAQYPTRYWEIKEQFPSDGEHWGMNGGGFHSQGLTLLGTTGEEVENMMAFHAQGVPLQFAYAEARYRLFERYERALLGWAGWRRNLLRTSLCSVYDHLVEAAAGTNLDGYARALAQARRYREALMEYLRPRVGEAEWFTRLLEHPEMEITDENRAKWRQLQAEEGDGALWEKVLNWDRVEPLDLRAMPQPSIALPELGARLRHAGFDLVLLLAFAAVPVAVAGRQALRAPVM